VSQAGVFAFRTGGAANNPVSGPDEQRTLYWVDRNGARIGQVDPPGMYGGIDLSPDGRRFVVHRHEGNGGDSWSYDLAQGRMQRLTFDATQDNASPTWSPDGTRIAFTSLRANRWGLYVKSADGTGGEELIIESEAPKAPMSWSPDGKLLVYWQLGALGDAWAVPLEGDHKPIPLLESQFAELFPQVSPDGKWLAYWSNETGRGEIYIKPFPEGPGKWQVSTEGGNFPRWGRGGKELYFAGPAQSMWVAEIRIEGSAPQPGVPQSLFTISANPTTAFSQHVQYHRYAVTADGERFLLSAAGGAAGSGGLADAVAAAADQGGTQNIGISPNGVTVVVNWTQVMK
jgi:hypothetical protein